MRATLSIAVALFAAAAFAQEKRPEPILIAKPDAFKTLVNPNCSHCVDEAKRRKDDLKDSDPVLCWTRGYSDGGAIPLRFFLNTYRVISDSYGVFVYDPDAGYARGFAASDNFEFHGWRNGVMVMKDKTDGTLYSCLSGVAFEGKRNGERLIPIPTIVTTWGEVMKRNPNAVAYHMFEKYAPSELPGKPNEDSVKTRPDKLAELSKGEVVPRRIFLKGEWRTISTAPTLQEQVLSVRVGNDSKALQLQSVGNEFFSDRWLMTETVGGKKVVVFWHNETSASAYFPVARQPRKWKAPNPDKSGVSPPDAGELLPGDKELPTKEVRLTVKHGAIIDEVTETTWGIDGRGVDGPLKGWTLDPVDDCVVCKYFAYVADYRVKADPARQERGDEKPDANKAVKQIAGTAEFLRLLPKPYGVVKAVDAKARTVSLLLDGEKTAKVWAVEPDAEVWVHGFWGRLEQFKPDDKVWVWLKLDRKKQPVAVVMLADETSELAIHGTPGLVVAVDTDSRQPADATFTLQVGNGKQKLVGDSKAMATVAPGAKLLVITEKDRIVRFRDATKVEELANAQREHHRKLWREAGLPGTLTFHHVFSGELEVMLDHEGMRWGRSLKEGDKVELTAVPPIKAVVKAVTPWRERTNLRLVVGELESSELKPGQRIGVKITPPVKDVDESPYPPDLGRKRTADERVEWFLASMYCVCGVGKDTCTGHFYTLAGCNPNGCGAPNATRDEIRGQIEKGKTDKEIWDGLLKDRGVLMTLPHLRP